MIRIEAFGKYDKYYISSDELTLGVTTLGATITDVIFEGKSRAIGYAAPEEYLKGADYLGATVGRYANRIGGSRFSLDGTEYKPVPNEGENQLHGGPDSWDKREWSAEQVSDSSVRFTILSPDGDNGFPGNMTATATFTVKGSSLRIDFTGETDKATVYAPTNHVYFNLAGEGSVLDTKLRINSSLYLEPGAGLIPTGLALPCIGDFDFSSLRPIGGSFDHAFVLNGKDALRAELGNIALEMKTDFPAVQLYTGDGLTAPFGANGGFAIEAEYYPDSPNHPEWPSVTLRPGETFRRYVEYTFEVI